MLRAARSNWHDVALCAEISSRANSQGVEILLESRDVGRLKGVLVSRENISELLASHANSLLQKFIEWREKANELQLFTLAFYQPFVQIEVEGGTSICFEEKDGRLAVVLGSGDEAKVLTKHYRANGEKRKTSLMQKSQIFGSAVTVGDLLNWLGSADEPLCVQEHGFTAGLMVYLENASTVKKGMLDDFLSDTSPTSPLTPSRNPFSRTQDAFGKIREGLRSTTTLQDLSDKINLTVVFSNSEFESKPTWSASINPSCYVSELQSMAEQVLGDSLARLVSQTGLQLDPGASIYEVGLRDGDTVIAEFSGSFE